MGFGDGDIRIDPQAIERRQSSARRPDRYFAILAPFAVGELLDRSRLKQVTEPTVTTVLKAPIPGFEPAPDVVTLCGWFVPAPEELRILLRRRDVLPVVPQPVPVEGPFALPEALPPWSPSPPKYREELSPQSCPHCQVEATRFRDLGGALVCLTCGRSFAV